LGKLLYHLFIYSYAIGARLIAYWNPKARQWLTGRKIFPSIECNQQQTIWLHCASLGEFEQGRPLLEKIKEAYPQQKIVLTFFSPSGYETMKHYKGADYIFYLPMDSKANARKFIKAINPSLVLWVKYEFWFYYLTELKASNIPVLMVSGLFRQSQPFFKWYGAIWRQMLASFTHFFLQNEASIELLKTIGISQQVSIAGDTRFDRVIEIAAQFQPIPLIAAFCGNSKVLVAGSTWEEDEEELVHFVRKNPDIKFILAPHEIDEDNLKSVKKEFSGAIFFSEWKAMQEQTSNNTEPTIGNVLIIDNIGMLSRLYYYADITYVGGGFDDGGIHNVLEPAVFGKPVIFGPVYQKFSEAVDMVDCGAGISIETALELEDVLIQLWSNENLLHQKSEAAKKYVYSNAGATAKVMHFIQENRLLTN
jgi:3-deoxy-D-manno-octulosonic-acid transferase